MTLRIGIDGRPLAGKRTGVGRYVFELCKELDKMIPEAQFFVYSQVPVEMPVISERWILRLDSAKIAKYMKPVLWLKVRAGELCKKDRLNVYWSGATFLPKLEATVKTVVTVHDITFSLYPETMSFSHLLANRLFFKRDISRANIILANSQGTADRLYNFCQRKITAVIPPGISDIFSPSSEDKINECKGKLNIQGSYILSVATWEPRKNLELLIKTFVRMRKELSSFDYKLVLVGGRGWKDGQLLSLIEKQDRDAILPLGYLPDELLPALYSGAELFVFPSVYEGFGMPVLEARACGTKVVTTDIPELREAGGTQAIYLEDVTSKALSDGIMQALTFKIDQEKFERTNFTWRNNARILASALI